MTKGKREASEPGSPAELSERYEALIRAFDGFVYICSSDFRIEYMNRQFIERCGRDGTGELCYAVIHKLDAPCPWCVNERVFKGETVRWELESPLDKKWYYSVNLPLCHDNGTVSKFSMITDITERKAHEKALRENEKRFRELADTLPLTVYEADLAGQFNFVNSTGLSWFGYSLQDLSVGVNIVQTVVEEERGRALETVRQLFAGKEPLPNEYTGLRKDGSTFPVLIVTRPIMTVDGKPAGIRGIVMDITERKRIEAALQNSQKLESLSVLAGGIAHDFNNLLSGIFGYLHLARSKVPNGEAKDNLDQAMSVFSRARALTQQLLTFAKGGFPVKKSVAVPGLLNGAVRFALSGSNIIASFDVNDDLWSCDADEHQISQVIDNVVINAREAMPLGGMIRVSARNVEESEPVPAPLSVRRYVKIEISDSGIGIPADILGRIFDPFFSTKQHGSGLGLATAYSIVKKHEGHIFANSVAAMGSTFTIFLPASIAQAETARTVDRRVSSKANAAILVVDDEEFVLKLCEEIIRDMGHTVTLAKDGREALELFRKAGEAGKPFDCVVLDLTIPGGMGGLEAIREMVKVDPSVVAIASSGYSDDPVMAQPGRFGFKARLTKPYLPGDLQAAIQDALAVRQDD